MDRNFPGTNTISFITVSLSARRAWIEMVITAMTSQISVSLSARRAWIEIVSTADKEARKRLVALRKESVDRNIGASYGRTAKMGRSPQGERG